MPFVDLQAGPLERVQCWQLQLLGAVTLALILEQCLDRSDGDSGQRGLLLDQHVSVVY